MAPSKRKKTIPSAGPKRGGHRAESWKAPRNLNSFFYAAAVLLAVGGQILVLKGSFSLGICFSGLGVLVFAAVYLGYLNFSKINFQLFLPPSPRPSSPPGRRKLKNSRGGVPRRLIHAEKKHFSFTLRGVVVAVLLLASLGLGVKGQMLLRDMSHPPLEGLKYYFGGVLLFIVALWPWKREELKMAPLNPKTEWVTFGLIMVLAAFLRIYKLDTIPSGIFFDMGFQGYGALKILHEGWRPFNLVDIGPMFPSAPVPIYFGAIWFMFFKNTQFNLNLFYVFFCLASFPLIYWTFRQLAGPRVALLTLFILAVMRWNLTFARNSFPPALIPFFMFGTLALLLHGLRTQKRWTFVTAAILFGVGLYTYQSYKAFLLVVLLVSVYECVANWKAVKANFPMILVFSLIFLALASPMIQIAVKNKSFSTREDELSIMHKVKMEKSWAPLIANTAYTALMFNRRGDPNPRHNLQDHRQLDDVTGILLFFGLFYALFHFWRRKYFYALSGFFVMSLPCLLTIDPAHSSRMYGMTAFVAFLSASALAALWGRLRAAGGFMGEMLFLLLLIVPLVQMTTQNYKTYFIEQAGNISSWGEFSTAETTIGRKFAEYGDKYDCYVSPRYYGFFTITYLDYFFQDKVKRLDLQEGLASLPGPGRGLLYGLEQGRTGVLDTLKSLYPGGEAEIAKDPNGTPFVYFYRVPPEVVDKARGLKARFLDGKEEQVSRFPEGLPAGRATFTGDIFIDVTGPYHFNFPKGMSWSIGGIPVREGGLVQLIKGIHPIEIHYSAPGANVNLSILEEEPSGKKTTLGPDKFLSLPFARGLKAQYYASLDSSEKPFLVEWEPVLNFVNGNDFPSQGSAMGIHWSGILNAPTSGLYHFSTRTSGEGRLTLDRREVIKKGEVQGQVQLTSGPHSVDVYYQKPGGWGADFSFLWMKPGDRMMDVVPNSAFGEVR